MSGSPYRRTPRDAPRLPRRRSPWLRVVLAALVVAMLPFIWSEDTSCDGQPKPLVSGFTILFGKGFDDPQPGMIFMGMLGGAVALGFLVARTQRPWRRLAGEIVAGLAGLGTTLLCVLMFTHGRPEQPHDHPAAWIGTLSALAIAFEAWWCAGEALRRGQQHRRARRAEAARIAAGDPAPMRIAPPLDDDDPHAIERELEDEEAREREREHELEGDGPRAARKRLT